MECRNARSLVDDYLDGVLDEATRSLVEAHLEVCGLCRSEFDEIRRYREAVYGLPRVKVPDDFLRGIQEKLEADTARSKHRGRFTLLLPRTLSFGAAAAAAAFAFIFVFHAQRLKTEKPPEQGTVHELQATRHDARGAAESPRAAPNQAMPGDALRTVKTPDALVPSAPQSETEGIKTKNVPLEITLVLERSAPTRGVEPVRKAETSREGPSEKKTAPNTRAARRGEERAAEPDSQSSKLVKDRVEIHADEPVGGVREEAAVSSLEQARDDLASIIVNSGGRIVGTGTEGSPPEVVLTVLAELPATEFASVLTRLEGLGPIRNKEALALSETASRNTPVELRIRLIYRPEEDADTR